ncbi:hypothetical protein CU633_18300 [Bacillus sp. V3-13]|uniref:S8 family peptidase n=1 Tax=Bacillus sp. V3-13 TaxID=2053728 RepID=UPI000C764912|nr:S8 family peptidase [Bacillus sp. V3-13]PLR75939.1 hypothetical protein CU633_18300 [Bacillus sp. V3-13]
MKKLILLFIFAILPFFYFSLDTQASEENNEQKKVIITYKKGAEIKTFKNEKSMKVHRKFKEVPIVTATLSDKQINTLKKDTNVLSIEEDKIIKIQNQAIDWGVERTGAQFAKNNGLSGWGVNVAVIDTGIANNHSDLNITGGTSVVDYTSSYDDDNGHGTHVAGIIAAKDNDTGIIGVSPNANLYAIKALDAEGNGYISSIIAGIDWAISNNMDLINISAGSPYESPALEDAVNLAYQKGILVVAAAGNDGNNSSVNYPAQYSSVIAVSALDELNNLADFSSTGPKVEVSAPGVEILSTCLLNAYCKQSGTSMAAPFVTGFLALLKESNPLSTQEELRTILNLTTKDLGTAGKDNFFGHGLISFPNVTPVNTPDSFDAVATDINVNLSWSPVHNAKSYTLLRDGKTIYNGALTNFLDEEVVASTNYQYTIYANDAYSKSLASQLTVDTKTRKQLSLRTITPLYNNIGDVSPISYLSPQTIYYFENSGNWYKIHSWLGDKWIQIQDYPMITFIENTPMYDLPNNNAKIQGYIGPQSVKSVGMFENWFLIETWLGDKWVKKENVIYGLVNKNTETIRYDDITGLYNSPFSHSNPIQYISPQSIVSFESWNGWYHVHTWLGDKWVPGKHALVGPISQTNVSLIIGGVSPLYQSPFTDSFIMDYITPQTVRALEYWNGWYRINTWIGPKWVQGQHATVINQ